MEKLAWPGIYIRIPGMISGKELYGGEPNPAPHPRYQFLADRAQKMRLAAAGIAKTADCLASIVFPVKDN